MKSIINILFAAMFFLMITVSCSDNNSSNQSEDFSSVKFMVISDAHIYDTNLGTTGSAYEAYIQADRKLLAESEAIIDATIETILNEKPTYVLIAGDLTKDGEKQCHELFARKLKTLKDAGIAVYVICGNHDIQNPMAVSFSGSTTSPVASVTAEEFKRIYQDYGYSQAISTDENSLSYSVALPGNVILICMDDCRYKENTTSRVDGGRFSEATLAWIKKQIVDATAAGKTVWGMMHHGIVEHFSGEKTNPISSDCVADDWQTISADFASLGMQIVFTGHFHATDVTAATATNIPFYDIETGSLLTYPCPIRTITYNSNKQLNITTNHITNINYNLNGQTFPEYAKKVISEALTSLFKNYLMQQLLFSEADATALTPVCVAAFFAHYCGDETMPSEYQPVVDSLLANPDFSKKLIGAAITTLFTDLAPADNNLIIDLKKSIATK